VVRLLLALLIAGACGTAAFVAATGTGEGPPAYTVELDNAFGLVEGSDVKVAGVRAGQVTGMRVDARSKRALIDFEIDRDGFGSLRADAFCESRPQSLIGEYFIDCRPGTGRRVLGDGGTIPVEQTASTIPVDLINNVMSRPYRERLGIILDELGAGVGARAPQIQEAVRRAVPALRETDRVLAILAEQNGVLADLVTNADTVVGNLAGNRRDVGRWVREARQTASATAERRAALAASLRRLPGFLRELRPTLAKLGAATDAQAPALQDLDASAGELERLFENLEPFSEATRDGMRSLAELSRAGRPALRAAGPTIAELDRFSTRTPELASNLAIVLDDLDDRGRAVERDRRSPGGQGYTGFEALLQYVFDQTMAINAFDSNGYMLKVDLFLSKCSQYQNVQSLREEMKKDPAFYRDCAAILGPNQPGITQPDPSYTGAQEQGGSGRPARAGSRRAREQDPPEPPPSATPPPSPQAAEGGGEQAPSVQRQLETRGRDAERRTREAAKELEKRLEDTLGIDIPDLPAPPELPAPAQNLPQPQTPQQAQPLLDYLLGP
jgi:phospholipid/cholesterol/gamma-HCH transport system substrate-binding protein